MSANILRKIAIIAPCYNGENYIVRFLDSILNQTNRDIQLIIVNDGSTDSTEEKLKSYEQVFNEANIDYIHITQPNQGIGGAINNALKLVRAEYLTWLGTDDFIYPNYVDRMTGFLKDNKDIAVVRCDGYLVDEKDVSIIKGNFAEGNVDKHNPYLFENAIMERGFHFGYSVLRMDVFDQCNPNREIYPSRQGQNWQLLLPIFYNNKAAFIDEPLYAVVDNSESVSRSPHKSYEKTKKQNLEYEKILVEVLKSMDIKDKEKYLQMVERKYIRRRMKAAVDFEHFSDARAEFSKLKQLGEVAFSDRKTYIRAKYPPVHYMLKKWKNK